MFFPVEWRVAASQFRKTPGAARYGFQARLLRSGCICGGAVFVPRLLACSPRHDTIASWESSSKTGIFLAELLCFVERECQSKPSSTTWKPERRSKSFSRGFPPYRVKPLSLLSKKQNICYSRVPKCAF